MGNASALLIEGIAVEQHAGVYEPGGSVGHHKMSHGLVGDIIVEGCNAVRLAGYDMVVYVHAGSVAHGVGLDAGV